ncbi:MAG TPA: hypothetical protein VF659_16660 [Pyrinomonadaceae bacterium]|jgi:hypothetical protein
MAEERNVGLARASDSTADADSTKAELQRRMEEARESISQTVTEIKDTVVTQYQQVKDNISDTLDWREQYRRHTLPFTLTAFAVGTFIGYTVRGAIGGGGGGEEFDEDTADAFGRIDEGFDRGLKGAQRSYAAQPVLGGAPAGAYQRSSRPESNASTESAEVFGRGGSESAEDVGPEPRPSYSSGYQAAAAPQALASPAPSAAEPEEPKGPGLIERFKETKAYDKLQGELATLGERAVEELSRTAQTVIVPALLSKLKDMIGIDLSTQREVAKRSRVEQQTAQTTAQTAAAVESHESGQGSRPAQGGSVTDPAGLTSRAAAGGTEGYGAS